MNFHDDAINLRGADCPYGRWSSRHHEGREFVNRLIASWTVRYDEAPMRVRKEMITRVLEVIASKGGRIKRRTENNAFWSPVRDEEARKIVANLFHEAKRTREATTQIPANQLQVHPLQPPRHQNELFDQDNQDHGAPAVGVKECHRHTDDNGEKQTAVAIDEYVDLSKLQSCHNSIWNGTGHQPYSVADATTMNCNNGHLGVLELDMDEAKSPHGAGGYASRPEEALQPPLQDANIRQHHDDDVTTESVLRRMSRAGSEGSMEDAEIRQLLESTLSPRSSPTPNEHVQVSPDSSLNDTQQYVFDRANPAGRFNPRDLPSESAGADNTQVRQAPQPQTLVELLPSLPLSRGVRVESIFLQRQYGRTLSCISAILRCTCDNCEWPFELCHFGRTIDCPFCTPDTASGNPGAKTGQNGGGGDGSNRNDTNWSSNADGHSHGGYPPGSDRGGQPFGGAPGQNNTTHRQNAAGNLHSLTQSESNSDITEQQDDVIATMKAGDDDDPMDSPAPSELSEDAVLASAFSVACTLQEEPKQTTAPYQHVASDLVVADASKNAIDRGFSDPESHTDRPSKDSFLNRLRKGSSDGINLMLQTVLQSRHEDVQRTGRDTSEQLSTLDEATKKPEIPHAVIDEQDFVVLPSELQDSDGYEPRQDDADHNLSKVLHRDSLAEVSRALPRDAHQNLPYDTDRVQAVAKYNMNVSVDMLKVKYEDVVSYMEELVQLCDGGLWRSLVYDPCDMSVYVRRLVHDEKGEELTVDVALCTQDFTWRSDNTLENVQECGDAVGRNNEMKSVPAVNQLPGIVQHVAAHRVVHAVRKYGRQVTVELATKFIGGRNNASYMDIQFPEEGKLKADFDELSSRRKPGARVEVIDMDIMYAWIICMYLMKRNEGSSEKHVNAVRGSLLAAAQGYNEGKMTMNLNYETMFLSRYRTYRDGRLSWPMVLGLVTANNLKPGIADQADLVDVDLASHIGTYNGRYSWRNAVALGISSLLLAVFIAAVNISIALGWSTSAVAAVVGVTDILYGGALKIVSSFLMDTENSFDMTKPDRRAAPPLQTLVEATKVLMSEFSTTHFSGTGLEFTGLVYTGKAEFSYRFSYEELFRMGFKRLCDCSGREHLLVPGKDGVVVRLDDDKNGFDVFTRVELPPNQRFAKLWIPNNDGPGEFYRLKTNTSTSAPRSRPRRGGETVASVEDIKDLDDWS